MIDLSFIPKNTPKTSVFMLKGAYNNFFCRKCCHYVFDYLTLTFSSLQIKRKEKRSEIIWLSIFQSVIDKYFAAVRYIISRPNNRQTKRDYYAHPERIKRWNNKETERYKELGKDADGKYFRYSQTERTVNTIENRANHKVYSSARPDI